MSKKIEYSVKSVSKGTASLVFIGLTFAIPVYEGYHLLKKKDESLQYKKQPSPLLITEGGLVVDGIFGQKTEDKLMQVEGLKEITLKELA
jgi:hypothetical protein